MRRKGWIMLSAILIACIALSMVNGQRTKESYVNNVELNDYLLNKDLRIWRLPYCSDTQFREDLPDVETIQRFEDVEAASDLVVKARLKEDFDRKMYHECILSQAEILEVYRGDLKKNDSIYLLEPNSGRARDFSDNILISSDGYNIMQESEEYILFLKKLKNSHYGEEGEKYIYVPSTTTFSKYKCSDEKIRLFSGLELGESEDFSKSKLVLYSEVKNEEVFLCDEADYAQYVDFKKQAMEYSKTSIQNKFDITESDSFSMSHFFNVGGVVGYEKTDFNQEEIQQILEFLASLKFKKTLEADGETTYGVPPDLTVYKSDVTIRILLYSKGQIQFIKEDKDGNIISREQYKTTARQLKNMFVIVRLPEKEA